MFETGSSQTLVESDSKFGIFREPDSQTPKSFALSQVPAINEVCRLARLTETSVPVDAVTVTNVRDTNERRVTAWAAQHRTHHAGVGCQSSHCVCFAAVCAGRFVARHLASENLSEQSRCRIAVYVQSVVLHLTLL